jgi:RNA polymerase sigma-70 factor (ECF subfamily)
MREVMLHWAMGVPVGVIAARMGIAAATVRVHLHQARLRLADDPGLTRAYRAQPGGAR